MKNEKAKHTPGPWEAEVIHGKNGYGFQVQGAYTATSAVIIADAPLFFTSIPKGPHATYDGQMANATLIAAAPELLAALEFCADALNTEAGGLYKAHIEQARAAIAKAKGI